MHYNHRQATYMHIMMRQARYMHIMMRQATYMHIMMCQATHMHIMMCQATHMHARGNDVYKHNLMLLPSTTQACMKAIIWRNVYYIAL